MPDPVGVILAKSWPWYVAGPVIGLPHWGARRDRPGGRPRILCRRIDLHLAHSSASPASLTHDDHGPIRRHHRPHIPLGRHFVLGIVFGTVRTKSEVISWFRIQEMFRFQAFHMYGIIGRQSRAARRRRGWCDDRSANQCGGGNVVLRRVAFSASALD